MYNENHIAEVKSGKVISFIEKMQFSEVPMFKAFQYKDLDMNNHIAIVTYSGLTNYPNMYRAIWKGKKGVDYFLFKDSAKAISKMNEIAKQHGN
jgi:hypothetical protein